MKKRIECMLESLTSCVENQLTHLETVDTKELGEAIDMIKDLEEAMYYCVITKAMEEREEEKVYGRDMDRDYGRMYYEERPRRKIYNEESDDQGWAQKDSHEMNKIHQPWAKDEKEGRSPHSRKIYMEAKAQHSDKTIQMKELENYMQELTADMVEMVEGSTQEEKQYLSKRIAALANKIQQLND